MCAVHSPFPLFIILSEFHTVADSEYSKIENKQKRWKVKSILRI